MFCELSIWLSISLCIILGLKILKILHIVCELGSGAWFIDNVPRFILRYFLWQKLRCDKITLWHVVSEFIEIVFFMILSICHDRNIVLRHYIGDGKILF